MSGLLLSEPLRVDLTGCFRVGRRWYLPSSWLGAFSTPRAFGMWKYLGGGGVWGDTWGGCGWYLKRYQGPKQNRSCRLWNVAMKKRTRRGLMTALVASRVVSAIQPRKVYLNV